MTACVAYTHINAVPFRNFRLADMITIMNGVCGSFSLFSSARYLLTNDDDYLWAALALPVAGLLFDFFDGKVARWRNETSMIGQELDSLADLVSNSFHGDALSLDLIVCRSLSVSRPLSLRSQLDSAPISIQCA